MNAPECAKCDDSRRDLCATLFEGYAEIDQEGLGLLDSVGIPEKNPEATMDMFSRHAEESAVQALGFLSQWGCELTVEQVAQRLLITKASANK